MTSKIDPSALTAIIGTMYPSPFDEPCRARQRKKLSDAAGLTQFGVNLLTLPPDAWSSQRHWHTDADEFVYVLQGEVTLVTDEGTEILRPGEAAGFKAGDGNGHCLQNHATADAVILEIGTRADTDAAHYPEIDLMAPPRGEPTVFTHRDGTPYEGLKRRDAD